MVAVDLLAERRPSQQQPQQQQHRCDKDDKARSMDKKHLETMISHSADWHLYHTQTDRQAPAVTWSHAGWLAGWVGGQCSMVWQSLNCRQQTLSVQLAHMHTALLLVS